MSGSDTLRVTTQLTQKGYRAVLLHLAALRMRLIVPVLAFFAFSALAGGFTPQALFLLGSLFAIVITTWGYIAWNVSSPSNIELYLPIAYEFDADGVTYGGTAGVGRIEWSSIRRWRYAADHYLLYVAGATYVVIPGADMPSTDVPRFEAFLRTHVPKGPRRLR